MKNSNDIIGNRTRDLSACSAVPQPTVPSRAPILNGYRGYILGVKRPGRKDDYFPPTSVEEKVELFLNSPHTFLMARTGTILR